MVSALVSDRGAVRRRDVLIGAGRGALGLALASLAATACGSEPPPDVDDLRAQLALAYDDSELARAAAPAAPRSLVPALTQVASERARHAQALADEISRTLGTLVPVTPTATSAARESGYRAGLLGSIAASCTAAYTVAFAAARPAT